MRAKTYPLLRRSSYLEIPPETFARLIRRMKPAGRQELVAHLPKARGFRQGTDAALKTQIRQWLLNLKRNSNAWSDAVNMLFSWVNNLASVAGLPPLRDILMSFDNESEDPSLDDPQRTENSELDIECFRHLRDRNRSFEVDRETISDFYELAYFIRDERIESIIADCWPRAELLDRRKSPGGPKPPPPADIPTPSTTAWHDSQDQSPVLPDSSSSLTVPSSFETALAHRAPTPSTADSAEVPSSEAPNLQRRVAGPEHLTHELPPPRADEVAAELADLSTRLTALELRPDPVAGLKPLLAELVATLRTASEDSIAVLRDLDRTVSRVVPALETSRSGPPPVTRPSDAALDGALAHHHSATPTACTAAPFPSEDTLLQHMGFTFQRWGLSSDDVSVRFAYVALQAFPILLATAPNTAGALQEVLSPDGVLRTFHVPGGWSSPEWIEALPLALTSLKTSLRFGVTGNPAPSSRCPAILRFEDYDRSLPEAYLVAAAKNVRQTRDALIIAARSADASHVLPSGTFVSLSCDVDVIVRFTGGAAPAPLERIFCHSPATDLSSWAHRRRLESTTAPGADLGIFESYLRAPAYRGLDLSCLRDALALSEALLPKDTAVQWLAATHVAPLLVAVDGHLANATELLNLVDCPNVASLLERFAQAYVG